MSTHVLVDDVAGGEGRQDAGQGGDAVRQAHQGAGEVRGQVHVVDVVPWNRPIRLLDAMNGILLETVFFRDDF